MVVDKNLSPADMILSTYSKSITGEKIRY